MPARPASTTRRSRRSAISTAISGSTGAFLDLCGAGLDQFDVPPDELVVFDGDPNEPLSYGDDAFDDILCTGGAGTFTTRGTRLPTSRGC